MENIGFTNCFAAEFNSGLNFIQAKDSDALAYALGRVTDNFPLSQSFPTLLKGNSRICSGVSLDKDYFFDSLNPIQNSEISSLLHQSREEDELCFYKSGKYKNHKARLAEYKDFEYFYTKRGFSKNTGGACLSRSFRAYLADYIRNFKPQRLNPKKNYEICINQSGEFFVEGNHFLSQSESTLFDFLCFLNITEFWEGFEEIKNYNRFSKPIIITELFELMDEAIPRNFILNRLKRLNRQIFLIERA